MYLIYTKRFVIIHPATTEWCYIYIFIYKYKETGTEATQTDALNNNIWQKNKQKQINVRSDGKTEKQPLQFGCVQDWKIRSHLIANLKCQKWTNTRTWMAVYVTGGLPKALFIIGFNFKPKITCQTSALSAAVLLFHNKDTFSLPCIFFWECLRTRCNFLRCYWDAPASWARI